MSAPQPRPAWPVAIFDADGTLFDTIELIVSSYQHVHRTLLGQEFARELILPTIGRTLADVYGEIVPERRDEFVAAYLEHNALHLPDVGAYPGVVELLHDLRAAGVRLAIATSKRRRSLDISLRATKTEDVFDAITTMDDTAAHKPDPEPLRYTLRALGAETTDAVYVGDAATDIQAAQAAGVASIGVSYGAGSVTELEGAAPDHVAHSVAELRALLLPR